MFFFRCIALDRTSPKLTLSLSLSFSVSVLFSWYNFSYLLLHLQVAIIVKSAMKANMKNMLDWFQNTLDILFWSYGYKLKGNKNWLPTFFSNATNLLMKITIKFPRATQKYHIDIDTVFIDSGVCGKSSVNTIICVVPAKRAMDNMQKNSAFYGRFPIHPVPPLPLINTKQDKYF